MVVKKSSLPVETGRRAVTPAEEVFGVAEVDAYRASASPAQVARLGLTQASQAAIPENEFGVLKGMVVTRNGLPIIKRNAVILIAADEREAMRKGRARTLELPFKLARELNDEQLKVMADFVAYDGSMQDVVDRKSAPYAIFK